MFTDEAIIKIKSGKGGNGCVSFRHEKYIPKGGPDGGDGGKGGDVYFVVSDSVHTLTDFARKKDWQAKNGEDGRGKKQTGKGGDDLFLNLPPGTVIKAIEEGENDNQEEVVYDLTKIGDTVRLVKGGNGGWGNTHFATAERQTPYFAHKGEPSIEKTLKLELKLIADIGLVGLPNAGKSTLLSRISNARPKIANYPFTTLQPNLGVAKHRDQEFVIADIPGLIEGASVGKGLGDKFLRHIERTKSLIHLIDINSQDAVKDYEVIREELKAWNPELLKKKEIVVLNKADVLPEEESKKITKDLSKKIKKEVLLISSVSGAGIEELLEKIASN
ncbi:MAG: GTPase ObgE [Patescibacteria group bacterium]|jgi:GTP-binding protein